MEFLVVMELLEVYEDVNFFFFQVDLLMEMYEDVGFGYLDFLQENYEGVDMFVNFNDDMLIEEYIVMDFSILVFQVEI